MKTPFAALALMSGLVLGSVALAVPAFAVEPIRTVTDEIPVGSAPSVQTKLRAGDLIVEGWGGQTVQATVNVGCLAGVDEAKCRRAANDVRVAWSRDRNQLVVKVKGATGLAARRLWIEARFKVPALTPLEVETIDGAIQVSGMQSSVEADVGTGDVTIVQRKASVGAVDLDVTAGNATLYVGGGKVEGTGLSRSVKWTGGEGKAKIEVDIGAGDATVRLD